MGVYFAEDATLINLIGMFRTSKSKIIQNLSRLKEDIFKHSSIRFELKKIKFISVDVAIANLEE